MVNWNGGMQDDTDQQEETLEITIAENSGQSDGKNNLISQFKRSLKCYRFFFGATDTDQQMGCTRKRGCHSVSRAAAAERPSKYDRPHYKRTATHL